MKIGIMGAGGVGAYFGAKLAAAGNDVTFIARGAHLDALKSRGMSVLSELGDVTLPKVSATDDPRAVGVVDFVFVDASVSSPERAWPRVRERFAWFSAAHVAVWPIFYATGEVDMNAALRANGLAQAEARFRSDSSARAAGYAYFTFEATPW